MKEHSNNSSNSESAQIDYIISLHPNWKGMLLSEIRKTVLQANPDIIEEVKWKMSSRPEGLPVWSSGGILCFAETWKDNIKLLFPKGVRLKNSKKLFNSRLESKTIRAIELREGDTIDRIALKGLVLEAIQQNMSKI